MNRLAPNIESRPKGVFMTDTRKLGLHIFTSVGRISLFTSGVLFTALSLAERDGQAI